MGEIVNKPTIIETIFKLKRGTSERWSAINPILENGEPGFVFDQNKLKIGDGITPWNSLPYIEGYSGIETVQIKEELPLEGNDTILYRVTSEKALYQYNSTTKEYEKLCSQTLEDNLNLNDRINDLEERVIQLENNRIDAPIASENVLGLVLGSKNENKIYIEKDGTMEVNSLNVNKLTQTDGEYLVMNGGTATI